MPFTALIQNSGVYLPSELYHRIRYMTLLIEGALFFAFGFRKKLSWVLFIIINLITQGLLNWQLCEGTVF